MATPEESAPDLSRGPRPMPEPGTIPLEIAGRIDRADIPPLCERVRLALEATAADVVVCDVSALAEPDCVAVDALARLQLTARRLGRRFVLRGVSPDLHALLCFAGLSEVLRRTEASGVEPWREPE